MDQDGDGVISMYEMEYFYEEQVQKMEAMGIEKLPFEDCLCQVGLLWTGFFFFFFFCVPQLYLWGSPLLGEIFTYVTVFF